MTNRPKTAILHYSAPPIVGGVESVMHAYANIFLQEGYPVSIIAGNGSITALPDGTKFIHVPLLDSQHNQILDINRDLEKGLVPKAYFQVRDSIIEALKDQLSEFDNLIVHNVFSKHFNLPLTDALHMLLDEGKIKTCIAWCHDFSWASKNSLPVMHNSLPWNLLRTYRPDIQYVVISQKRRQIMADIFQISTEKIKVVYNGINADELLGISPDIHALAKRFNIIDYDLILLMPVRVTKAKNIEFALRVVAALQSTSCQPLLILTGPPDPHDPDSMAYFAQLQSLRTDLGIEKNFQFIYEESTSAKPSILNMKAVSELYRICDLVFMPSHREGFGMPILEAGFLGKPVFASNIPAVEEIGNNDIHLIDITKNPEQTAKLILDWATSDPIYHLRKKTRREFTWQAIFQKQIAPMLVKRE
jgi:glycosyltransferase involved in cell wall biosynthesis